MSGLVNVRPAGQAPQCGPQALFMFIYEPFYLFIAFFNQINVKNTSVISYVNQCPYLISMLVSCYLMLIKTISLIFILAEVTFKDLFVSNMAREPKEFSTPAVTIHTYHTACLQMNHKFMNGHVLVISGTLLSYFIFFV